MWSLEPQTPSSPEEQPWGRNLIPCFLQGLGPKAQKVSGPAVMGHQAGGPQTWGSRATDTRERWREERVRGERGGVRHGRGGSRETPGKLSSVQSALAFCFSSVWSPALGMRPTPHER